MPASCNGNRRGTTCTAQQLEDVRFTLAAPSAVGEAFVGDLMLCTSHHSCVVLADLPLEPRVLDSQSGMFERASRVQG
jgi:hypothetical protein